MLALIQSAYAIENEETNAIVTTVSMGRTNEEPKNWSVCAVTEKTPITVVRASREGSPGICLQRLREFGLLEHFLTQW